MSADTPLPGLEEGPAPEARQRPHYLDHRKRLRQRFRAEPAALHDYEMLELVLFGAIPQGDVKPLAKRLIERFGSFADVITQPPEVLMTEKGIGEVAATTLAVVREAAIRLARAPVLNRSVIGSWAQLLDYCVTAMATLPTEHFRLLFLDRKNVLIRDEVQQRGTVDHTPLYPREVVKRALELHASAVIMVHNHPSGDPSPSKADIEMTRMVRDALAAVGISLHDHLIIGRKGQVSFKSMGLL